MNNLLLPSYYIERDRCIFIHNNPYRKIKLKLIFLFVYVAFIIGICIIFAAWKRRSPTKTTPFLISFYIRGGRQKIRVISSQKRPFHCVCRLNQKNLFKLTFLCLFYLLNNLNHFVQIPRINVETYFHLYGIEYCQIRATIRRHSQQMHHIAI